LLGEAACLAVVSTPPRKRQNDSNERIGIGECGVSQFFADLCLITLPPAVSGPLFMTDHDGMRIREKPEGPLYDEQILLPRSLGVQFLAVSERTGLAASDDQKRLCQQNLDMFEGIK
jgi:hypothetical protein